MTSDPASPSPLALPPVDRNVPVPVTDEPPVAAAPVAEDPAHGPDSQETLILGEGTPPGPGITLVINDALLEPDRSLVPDDGDAVQRLSASTCSFSSPTSTGAGAAASLTDASCVGSSLWRLTARFELLDLDSDS